MKLTMLTGMAGNDFSLAPGEVTDRFSKDEAKRLVDLGHAEKAPPPKKPETKKEWEGEREELLAEVVRLQAELESGKVREAALQEQIAPLLKLQDAISPFLPVSATETTNSLGVDEKRD
ncbi:hypothetical protein XM25_15270 [Devosia sp. H5989]|nr:hypothetical protein XM25_15270 [Devosia sp. H5989]